ncbi:MAG: hypothetical protein ABSG93_05995 [Solirubrobacteraceae bacterium]
MSAATATLAAAQQHAVEALRAMIVAGDLRPGQRLDAATAHRGVCGHTRGATT